MMTLAQAQALLQRYSPAGDSCQLVGAALDAETLLQRVHSDSRSLRQGDLFVALKGERFDAHDFLPQAAAAGAAAALVADSGLQALREAGLPGLRVTDTLRALGALARGWRTSFDLPLIAVTGSNGKTTVTQMVASILRAWMGEPAVLSTQGNFNNHIGVPLTLLGLRAQHRSAVLELGMNHPGEIAALAALAAPTVALVNNAQREHQEFMASVQAVAHENAAVIEALGPRGVAVFPADDTFTPLWRTLSGARQCLTFALQADATAPVHPGADVSAQARWITPSRGGVGRGVDGSVDGNAAGVGAAAVPHWQVVLQTPVGRADLQLPIAGLHNVKNALAACACALAVGSPLDAVVRGLQTFEPVKGRSQLRQFVQAGRHVTLVDDSYNANPDSVRAAIDVLAELPGPRWLVLGDMGEVGAQGPLFHREVGAYARERGIEALWTAGAACAETARAFGAGRHFEAVADLLAVLHEAPQVASVVVKGSRFMRMEQVVQALLAFSPGGDAADAASPPRSAGGAHAA